MGRVVYCPLTSLTVTAAADQDLWELATASTNKVRLLGWEVTSSATTAAALELRLLRGSASGSGGSTATEVLADEDDGSITAAVETLNTTPGTPGAVLQTFAWEQLGPLGHVYTPEMAPIVEVSSFIKLNLVTQPTSFELNGWICWEEL